MINNNFSPWPSFTREEADAVSAVLLSNKVNYWTGTETRSFETEFAHFTDCEHAIGLANGTVALDLALRALDIGSGDEVIVTPRSFIASASSVVTAGAIPIFADVDLESQNISAETIAKVITNKTKAIIVVHLAGMPAELDPIIALAAKHSIKVIEDCAQAHGATYNGRSVGSFGDIAAWSFCQDKIMTTGGEGGAVTTNDKALWLKMWEYKDHGKSWSAVYEQEHAPGFRWLHKSFGTNWRMMEMQAVLGRLQIKKMPEWTRKRQQNAEIIWQVCTKFNWLHVPAVPQHIGHAAYKAYVFVKPECLPEGWSRDLIIGHLNQAGIPTFSGSCSEMYLEDAFANTDYAPESPCLNARQLGETSLMFLVHPTLTTEHIAATCEELEKLNDILS